MEKDGISDSECILRFMMSWAYTHMVDSVSFGLTRIGRDMAKFGEHYGMTFREVVLCPFAHLYRMYAMHAQLVVKSAIRLSLVRSSFSHASPLPCDKKVWFCLRFSWPLLEFPCHLLPHWVWRTGRLFAEARRAGMPTDQNNGRHSVPRL